MQTRLLETSPNLAEGLSQAVAHLRAGEVVALPTETVYGLAADAFNPAAVAAIFAAKERPYFDPLIVHVLDETMLRRVAEIDNELVPELITRFWPGPLTLILPKKTEISEIVTAGSRLVGVRMPTHPVFRAVLSAFGGPLAAPSANPFGGISPTEAEHVRRGLGGRIPLILDAGKCQHGLESTIVYPTNGELHVLRAGPISAESLEKIAPVRFSTGSAAPGQLSSHYAPRKPLFLVHPSELIQNRAASAFLGFQNAPPEFGWSEVLSPRGDFTEAAANLFAALHRLDATPATAIYAEILPSIGLGRAIMDRLTRASFRKSAS